MCYFQLFARSFLSAVRTETRVLRVNSAVVSSWLFFFSSTYSSFLVVIHSHEQLHAHRHVFPTWVTHSKLCLHRVVVSPSVSWSPVVKYRRNQISKGSHTASPVPACRSQPRTPCSVMHWGHLKGALFSFGEETLTWNFDFCIINDLITRTQKCVSFPKLNKQEVLRGKQGPHNTVCLYVADAATFLDSN